MADGTALPPQIILSGKCILEKYIVTELYGDVQIAISDTGYSNDKLTLKWIKHYNLYIN
jgi:hypothetical protein